MDKNSKNLLIAGLILFVGAAVGFSLGRAGVGSNTSSPTQQPSTKLQSNPIFKSQTATFEGQVTSVEEYSLSVTDEAGQSGTFPISNQIVIYNFKPGSAQASASSDLKSIDLGRKAHLILELMDGEYKVTSVSFLPSSSTP